MSAEQALAELKSRTVGRATFEVVTSVAAKVVRSGKYRTPSGARRWNAHDVEDLVGDFFESADRAVALAAESEDADSLRSRIDTALVRLIVDRWRATPRGVLRRRTQRRLSRRPEVRDVPPCHWALAMFTAAAHWTGGRDPLDAAASAVTIDAGRDWTGARESPACTTASLDEVCDAVLKEAGAPVERPLVLAVVTDRVIPQDLNHVPAVPGADDDSTGASSAEESALSSEAEIEVETARTVASAIFEQLDDHERLLLPHLDRSAREVAAQPDVPLGKSAVAKKTSALRTKLRAALEAAPDPQLLLRCLLEVRAEWMDLAGQFEGGEP